MSQLNLLYLSWTDAINSNWDFCPFDLGRIASVTGRLIRVKYQLTFCLEFLVPGTLRLTNQNEDLVWEI